MSKDELKVTPKEQEVTNEELKDVNGGVDPIVHEIEITLV